ncbi:helix-turn-helix domain-containing protein [Xylanimonas protaetiae]|uniref:DNA-binding protein n=1 Tax=Xylanimonas protaetiae TaxID=2509457 RepID=A0A4P6F852_9MICO|nr:helix-turn-helix domain-containing protein [Xylanimonas protaetiae]QAY70479.1 DNA-binding protein [Xylanimonas protaetiae]
MSNTTPSTTATGRASAHPQHGQAEHLNPDPLLTVAEAAKFLTLTQPMLREAIREGHIASVRLSARGIRIRRSELDRYIDARTRPARAGR